MCEITFAQDTKQIVFDLQVAAIHMLNKIANLLVGWLTDWAAGWLLTYLDGRRRRCENALPALWLGNANFITKTMNSDAVFEPLEYIRKLTARFVAD